MCCCPDTTLEVLVALGANEEPPVKSLRTANLLDQLSLNFEIMLFLDLQP